MTRVLILCGAYPGDLSSGADLRFQNFCRQIAERNESYLVCLGSIPEGIDPKSHMGVRGYKALPAFPSTGKSSLRHLRLTNTHFLKRSQPAYLADAQETLGKLVAEWKIDVIVCLVAPASEMLLPIDLPKMLDCCDSRALTLRRILKNRSSRMPVRGRLGIRLRYFRERHLERALVRRFDRVTTISDADRDCLLEGSGAPSDKVVVIPNGVSGSALESESTDGAGKRSTVFWGNLDFPPNWTAIDYFCQEVFLPYLADKDVEWHIIGKGANDAIRDLAKHPQIHLHGFVEDLYREIASHGVMINPMVEGSGLKNKVLEAFACRLPVVSTAMGVEAVGANANEHFLVADDPTSFANAVLRVLEDENLARTMTASARQFVEDHFEWSAIGARLDQLIGDISV